HKGLIYAAQILATTMIDLYENPKYIQAMKEEFEQKRKGVVYQPFVPEGPPIIIKK
ncbi:MAG TPA: amidohydrolase, partial [Acidobacteria bacterium]|nr:amidohydrolase [Acidobacteriota bacterium]